MLKKIAFICWSFCLWAVFPGLASSALATLPGDSYQTWSAGVRLLVQKPNTGNTGSTPQVGGRVHMSTQLSPQLFVVYRPARAFSFELAVGNHRPIDFSKTSVRLEGSTLGNIDLGTVRMFPLTLTGQYRFTGLGRWEPYVAVGLNYIMYFKHHIPASTSDDVTYDDHLGLALGVGVDYQVSDNWFLNFDIKYLTQTTAIIVGDRERNRDGDLRLRTDVDPWHLSVGFGYHF